MIYILFPILCTIILLVVRLIFSNLSVRSLITLVAILPMLLFNYLGMITIESIKSSDREIWSGRIIEVDHDEEWDEWIPPTTITNNITDSKGNVIGTETITIPGYWVHHDATNRVKTSDDGWRSVHKSPDGKVKFNDKYPNTNEELAQYYPIGQPTASFHTYKNNLKFSKSLFSPDNVDKDLVEELPDYPNKVNSDFTIDRILGDVPNKENANKLLNEWNSELNKFVPSEENPNKLKSWKEVNVIFVNLGDLPIEYGYALEAKWEGANKNDFVIVFSLVNNEVQWVYPFSWTDIEILKLEVRDLILDEKSITDFTEIVDKTCELIAEKFERKEMADYNYLTYEHSFGSYLTSFIICSLIGFGIFLWLQDN